MKNFKPDNYNSVSPYLLVDDAHRMIKFLIDLFDAKVERKYEYPEGKIVHAEVRIDDSIIMLANSTEQYPALQYLMHVYVPDVDATFTKAVDLGCDIIEKPANKNNEPDKRGTFRDFAGNMWSVSTQV